MRRYIPASLVLLLCAGAAWAGAASAPSSDKKVVIRWHGQSMFEIISTKGTRIVIDPHAIDAYSRPQVQADLVLMTHFHIDHTAIDAVTNVKQAKQINALKKDQNRRENWNIIDAIYKDVRIQTVGTFHDDMAGTQRGKNGVFVLDVDGLRIVHLGDLGHLLHGEQLRKIRSVDDRPREQHAIDVVMIPVGGVYTLNGLDAQKVVEQLKPTRFILPMHYGTRVYSDLLDLTYFLDDQKMGKVERLLRTNELTIDPRAKRPEEPTIAILNWEKKGRSN